MDLEWIPLGAFTTLAVGMIAFFWRVNSAIIGLKDDMDKFQGKMGDKFVTKDICKVLSNQIQADIHEIKSDVKCLLRKNGG